MNDQAHPIVRLKPKANARAIRHGAPWVFDNEIVTDRRTRALTPGTIAVLEDDARQPMGLVTVNPNSRIFCRMLDRDLTAAIDGNWMADKVKQALDHRARLYSEPFYRLVHAEADGLPGVVIDRFGDTAVIQPNAAWADVLFEQLAQAVCSVTGVKNIVKNGTGRARTLEGLTEETLVHTGSVDAPIQVPMNGAIYLADLMAGQKTGLFFDQRPNHAFASMLAKDARVLDVFSHVGGFSLAALAGGAAAALAVDGSEPALALASQGAAAMGVGDRFSTQKGDAFDVMQSLGDDGSKYELVICDPPAFAPSKTALEPGLRAYERVARLAAQLVEPGGYMVLCSCSHAVDLEKFRSASVRGIGRAGRSAQLIHTGFAGPDHPLMPQLAESGYLKALFFRLLG
ncbi:MAG: class I SAM-dependent rRNA methyltransferase [Paracoccaceae bacterium]|nr:class I SAM-dependent rRNA methyltransferase [Paracoccaceae bacterium]